MTMFINLEARRFKVPKQTSFSDLSKKFVEKFKLVSLHDFYISYIDSVNDEIVVEDESDFLISISRVGVLDYFLKKEDLEQLRLNMLSQPITKQEIQMFNKNLLQNLPMKEIEALQDLVNQGRVPCLRCSDIKRGVIRGRGCEFCGGTGDAIIHDNWRFYSELVERRLRSALFPDTLMERADASSFEHNSKSRILNHSYS